MKSIFLGFADFKEGLRILLFILKFKNNNMTKEDKKDYLDMAAHFVVGASIFLLIAVLGSSVKAPWLAIPFATIATSAAAYFADVDGLSKKDRIIKTIRWGGAALAFTTAAVLAS